MPDLLHHLPPGFVAGAMTAVLLMLAGVSLGLWVARYAFSSSQSQTEHVRHLMGGLFHWTHGFAEDVTRHRNLLNDIASRYSNDPTLKPGGGGDAEEFLSQISSANERLRSRLELAEATLQQQAEEISAYLSEARTDALTGLPNRRAFDDELARRFAEWKRHRQPLSVLVVDVDRFKKLNDRYGHLAGDMVLAEVARRLASTMRESDLVARFGGEEFAMILPATKGEDAGRAAERARLAVERTAFEYEGGRLPVTVSCGAAEVLDDESAAALIKRADMALYAAKDGGRNQSHVHNGNRCVAVGRPRKREQPQPDEGFTRVCADLRQRLMEITVHQEDDSPAERGTQA